MNSTTHSELLFERAKKVAPGGVHSPVRAFRSVGGTPRFIKEAKGSRLIDVDGNQYIDFCMAWGPLIFGHREEEIEQAAHEALAQGWSFGTTEPYSLELAELLTGEIPWLEKVRFVNSGTEAVMSALRVARAATRRNKIVKFDGCYHGHVDSLLVRAGSGLTDFASPDSAGISSQVAQETLVCPLDDLDALQTIFDANPNQIAAVIVEPVPANNGLLLPQSNFLDGMSKIARQNGALVIFDEVITGFRLGFRGVAEKVELKPDLVCYGKVIGGGFPVGAYGGRREWMDLVAPQGTVYQAGTLSANPVAMRAGTVALKKLLRTNPYEKLATTTSRFAKEAESLLNTRYPTKIQTEGSLFWMAATESNSPAIRRPDQIPTKQREVFSMLFHSLLANGVYLAPSGFEVGFLSTAHTDSDLDFTLTALKRSIAL